MLIYIVEDDTDIRELESYAMKSSGYEVQSFGESKSFFKACTILQNRFPFLSLFQESVQSSADVLLMTDRM